MSNIDSGTLVIIDEAGMAGTADLAATVGYVTARGGSVRLVGDDQQLAAVGAGGVLRDIAEEVGAVTLSELMRFEDSTEAAVTLALRDGDAAAIGFYADRGRLHVADQSTLTDAVFTAWATDRALGRESVMVAGTNDQVTELNSRARDTRLAGDPALVKNGATDAQVKAVLADPEMAGKVPVRYTFDTKTGTDSGKMVNGATVPSRSVVAPNAIGSTCSGSSSWIWRRVYSYGTYGQKLAYGMLRTDWCYNGQRVTYAHSTPSHYIYAWAAPVTTFDHASSVYEGFFTYNGHANGGGDASQTNYFRTCYLKIGCIEYWGIYVHIHVYYNGHSWNEGWD